MQAFAVKVHHLVLILQEFFHQIITNHCCFLIAVLSDSNIFVYRDKQKMNREKSNNYTGS